MDNVENNKKILIIEEQSIAGLELQKKLETCGYEVQRANTFEEVDTDIKTDLVVSDSAPKEDSFFQLLKKTWISRWLPVICTGTGCMEKLTQVKRLKIIANYLKPFDSKEILARVNKYFHFNGKKLTEKLLWKRKN